jgi:predicted RNA-binding Zn ribbon-like protein
MVDEQQPRDVVLAFANTHADGGGRRERFGNADGLREWLDEQQWLAVRRSRAPITDADAIEARELRDAIVTVLLQHSGDADTAARDVADAERVLRRAGERYPIRADIDRAGSRLRAAQDGVPGALAAVLAAVAELSLAGRWPRMKACRNQPCHFAFADRTRDMSATFCSPQCAGQATMRNYRARQRAAKADAR